MSKVAGHKGLRSSCQSRGAPIAAHALAGAVHWGPPAEAIAEAASHATEPSYSAYGPDEGLPQLRSALQEKIERDNGLAGVRPAAASHMLAHA